MYAGPPVPSDRSSETSERAAITKEFHAAEVLPHPEDEWALIILWSAREPQRIGEIALLGHGAETWALGRAPASVPAGSGEQERGGDEKPVSFFRQRPAGLSDGGTPQQGSQFLLGEGISRRQLIITPRPEGLGIHNIGRCPLFVNGQPLTMGIVPQGATLQLKGQLLLYCTRRATIMPQLRYFPAPSVPRFGQPDAFGLVGESLAAWLLRERLAVLSQGTANVLIIGESGSGKELAAQTIHGLSARSTRQLVSTNIAAVATGLAAVQLFGNRKGFPESKIRPTQMRIELSRRFPRSVKVPMLQERREDIPLLIVHLLRECRRKGDFEAARFFDGDQPQLHPNLVEFLIHHAYKTHVAEIGNLLGQAMAHSRGRSIEPLPGWQPLAPPAAPPREVPATPVEPLPAEPSPVEPAFDVDLVNTVQGLRARIKGISEAERQTLRAIIESSYRRTQGDFSKTAELLGLTRYQLYRLLARLKWKPVRLMTLGNTQLHDARERPKI
jgi:transcriptional regulator with AAA-type ATPase domain